MTDWSGLKYIVVAESGESIDILFARFKPENLSTEKNPFHLYSRKHTTFDGIGAFADILEEQGCKLEELPQLANSPEPKGLWQKLKKVYEFGRHSGPAQQGWKENIDFEQVGLGDGFAYAYFDTAMTKDILKKKKLILSAFLIRTLDQVAEKHFLKPNSTRKWVLPMNLRTPERKNYRGNSAAAAILRVQDSTTEIEIQNQLSEFITKSLHWGSWYYTNLPRYIGLNNVRRLSKNYRNAAFGILTFMGNWPLKSAQTPPEVLQDVWTTISPPSRVVPVSSSCMIWNGQLTLTLRLHPSLKADLQQTEDLMKAWVQEIGKSLSVPLESVKIGSQVG